MTSFFDRLKRGMAIKSSPEKEEADSPEVKPRKEKKKKTKEKESKKPLKKPSFAPPTGEASEGKEEKKEEKKIVEEKKVVEKQEPPKVEIKEVEVLKDKKPEQKKEEIKEEKNWFEPEGQLAVDVFETNGEIVIQAAIAGIKPEELDITFEKDVVIIKGVREKTLEKEERNYFYQECYWGRFIREIVLPAEVDASRTEAKMRDGILTIRVPKIERGKKRKILIKG